MKKIFMLSFFLLSSCTIKNKGSCELCIPIKYDEISKMENNNETFILIIKNDKCSLCQEYNYILDKYIKKNNFTIYSIDSNLINLDNSEMKNYIDIIKEKAGVNDNAILPATLFYLDGILLNVEIGVLSEKELHNNIDLLFSL